MRAELAAAPGDLGHLAADAIRTVVLSQPARAKRQMAPLSPTPLDAERMVDVSEPFVGGL